MDENGKHLLIDLYTNENILNNSDILCGIMIRCIELSGNTMLKTIRHKFEPQGLSCVALLKESHMSIHTYPERNYVAMDLYTCGNGDPMEALDYIVSFLKPYRYTVTAIARGSDTKIIYFDSYENITYDFEVDELESNH